MIPPCQSLTGRLPVFIPFYYTSWSECALKKFFKKYLCNLLNIYSKSCIIISIQKRADFYIFSKIEI